MKKKVAVVGVGSAGLLNVMHLCVWLDKSWEVYSIHNPHKKILGIGESTNGEFVTVLERATNFSIAHPEDVAALGATIKYGSRFVEWREHQWHSDDDTQSHVRACSQPSGIGSQL